MEDGTFEDCLELADGGFGDMAGDMFRMFCP